MTIERKRGFIRPDEDGAHAEPTRWGLPDYGSVQPQAKETAFNYDPGWVPSLPEVEEEAPLTLTEEQIEIIKQGAYQEGLLLGQEAGFTQGYEKGKAEGLEAGHGEGRDNGYQEGLAAGQSEVAEHVNHFIALADKFAAPLQLMDNEVERQLVDMVLSLVREVVQVEAKTNPQMLLDGVKQCVESLPITGHSITLQLHPQDVEIVRDAYGEEALTQRDWTLMAEPALNRGDIDISASESQVHYRIDERVKQVINRFCDANRHQSDIAN
ncbi:flagellar assembly protein FliH [Vibrio sp. SM6]|uniref:Flagellar assembly protein FliH n=1 Tax=Vibrio agarilyticus TaxID=2726741 RepID=A0A7X8TR41_9VIBR|nr:flagellar assembly protein FliH [Vibrio agarilyticus]NLS13229.1 flagellar assembly protein FliH [Vibrio agarilyticus]